EVEYEKANHLVVFEELQICLVCTLSQPFKIKLISSITLGSGVTKGEARNERSFLQPPAA
nr:hypothetical protein [Spirochaetales bacterium]